MRRPLDGAWVLSQAATSASTACPNSVLAPLRKTSVSGSENVPGWVSSKTLVSVTAYHSFIGEVEALNTPTIRRLTPSRRHQLLAIAPGAATTPEELQNSFKTFLQEQQARNSLFEAAQAVASEEPTRSGLGL